MIDQITVFLENKEGRLAALCRAMGDAGINMHALTIADTTDYGVVRVIADRPATAVKALAEAGYRASIAKVSAIAIPNEPGALAGLLELFDANNIDIQYGYCMSMADGQVVDILKVTGAEEAAKSMDIEAAGYKILQPADVYALD
ncbi:MAG: amino acid-binding protein [Eggerthellaceae bacterium]|nr:amino acid-binding protein [Eggerthellaceae bacterium]